ncbi:type IV secretion system protein [Ralstonia sp. 121560039-2]|jgi:type IV secretion system protein TrbL
MAYAMELDVMRRIRSASFLNALIGAVILLVLVGGSGNALADSGGSQSVSLVAAGSEFISQVVNQLNSLESSLQSAFSSMSSTLSANGKELEWALYSVMFVWTGVTGMLKGETLGEVFAHIIMHTLMLGIVMMCLNPSSQSALARTFSTIASQFNADGANLAAGFKGFFTAVSSLWTDGGASSSSSTANGSGGWFSSLFHTIGDFDLGSMLAALAIVILKVITTVVIAGAAAIWAANYILSQAKLFIGMAVAPVMVPWLIMPYTTFLFDGWLKFMIGAGMMQVVGAIMIKITNILVTTMMTIAAGSTSTNVILYVVLVVLAFIISYLMAEINGIAMGLLQGGSRVGFGFNSLSQIKQYGPHRAMGYAGGKTAALAGKGLSLAGRGVKSAGLAAGRGVANGFNRARGGGAAPSKSSATARNTGGSGGGGVRATMAQARNGGNSGGSQSKS